MTTKKLRSPNLRRLEEIILAGTEHAALVTCARMCEAATLGETLREVAALANTNIDGPRFVVFGARRDTGGIELVDLNDTDHEFGAKLDRVIAKYLEPQLRLRYVPWTVRSKSLGVLIIERCEDAPYLIRKDAPPVTRVGDAWIRREDRSVRMRRGDLDKLYAEKLSGRLYDGGVRVQFVGDPPSEFIRLTVTDTSHMPSRVAADKLSALIEARQLAMTAASSQLTYIGRLSQARIMGCDTPYDDKGLATLRIELAAVADAYRAADELYRFDQQAHNVNLQLTLDGDCDIECASLVLHIPANVGLSVADASGSEATGAPQVEAAREAIRISETYERLRARERVVAFRQALRIVVEPSAVGHKIPVHYRLHGRNLRYAISGKLYIICSAAATPRAAVGMQR